MDKSLVEKTITLEKFHGKGGWTYARVKGIAPDHRNKFGWVKVKGFIDSYEIKKYHLAPMDDGCMFLPVRAEIRKAIKKEEGDKIKVVLFLDKDDVVIPPDFMECMQDEPAALRFFRKLSDTDQQNYIDWIYSAKREETKIDRMAKAIEKLSSRLRFYDKMI